MRDSPLVDQLADKRNAAIQFPCKPFYRQILRREHIGILPSSQAYAEYIAVATALETLQSILLLFGLPKLYCLRFMIYGILHKA